MAGRSVSERPAWARIFVPPRGPLLASARGLGAMSGPERQVERSLQWGIWWSGCPCVRLVPCRLPVHPFSHRLPQSRPTDTVSFLLCGCGDRCSWSTAAARWPFSWHGAGGSVCFLSAELYDQACCLLLRSGVTSMDALFD